MLFILNKYMYKFKQILYEMKDYINFDRRYKLKYMSILF